MVLNCSYWSMNENIELLLFFLVNLCVVEILLLSSSFFPRKWEQVE